MKRIIIVLLSMLALNAGAQQYESRGDIQYPQLGLTDLQIMEGAYIPLTGILLQDGDVYTNISTLSATFMYGYSATSSAFVIVTNTTKTPSAGSFFIPIPATQTTTNGHFWYTIKYTTADNKPFFTGTGSLDIVHTTAAGSPSSITWQTPVNWEGFVYTNGQTHGPVLPGSNVLTRPGPNGSYYIDAQVLQLVDVAQEAIDASSASNRAVSDGRYAAIADAYATVKATNDVVTAFPGIVNAGDIAGNSSAISVLQTGKVGVAEFQASNGVHSSRISILETGKVSQAAWQASNAVLQANINAAEGLATMGGDVTGPSTNATVVKIQNIAVDDLTAGSSEDGYGLKYDHGQGKIVLGPVAATGNSISNLVIISNTASSTDVSIDEIGIYRTIRPGDMPSMVLNVGGYEVAYMDLLGITLQSGSLYLLNTYLSICPAAYDGTVTAPAYTWDEDRDLGKFRMSWAGDYAEAFCVQSNIVWFWASDGIHLTNGAKIVGMNYNDLTNKPDFNSFQSNLTAHVASNNVSFASLQTQVSSNDSDIVSLQAQISSNNVAGMQAQITSNDVDIASLQAQMSTNSSAIASVSSNLSAVVGSNTTAHSSFTAQIGTNNTSISSLQAQVSSNDTDITFAFAQIGTNSSAIATVSSNLASHAASNTSAFSGVTNAYTAAISNWASNPATAPITLGGANQGIIKNSGATDEIIAIIANDLTPGDANYGPGFIAVPTNSTTGVSGSMILLCGGYDYETSESTFGEIIIQQSGSMGNPYAQTPVAKMDTNSNWGFYGHSLTGLSHVIPVAGNAHDLGSTALPWHRLYLGDGDDDTAGLYGNGTRALYVDGNSTYVAGNLVTYVLSTNRAGVAKVMAGEVGKDSGAAVSCIGTNKWPTYGLANTLVLNAGNIDSNSVRTAGRILFMNKGWSSYTHITNDVVASLETNGDWNYFNHYLTAALVSAPTETNQPANKMYVDDKFSGKKSCTNSWVDAGGITNQQIFLQGLLSSWTTNGVEL